ncbi:hypothetical protein B0H13DRAFT_2263331 [Mycena leptocephala]|nr:hypothetical protein B0H13DRAFT_2263331 [Mycena leptocephala]
MAPKAAPPPTTLTLRPGRDAHPGEIAKARPKRTAEEMKKLRQEASARKAEAAENRKAGIAKAATVEVRQEVEDRANDRDGNNPPPTTMQKVLRPRPEQTTEPENENSGNDGDVIDPCSSGPGSSDEFQLDGNDAELDLSEDEEAIDKGRSRKTKVTGTKKQKGSMRNAVAEARAKISAPDSTADAQGPQLGGLRETYKRGRTSISSQFSQRSQSAGSAMSVDRTSVGLSENESVPPSEYQDSSEGLGGIGSDIDDGDEAGWARERDKEKINSLAGIVDTDAPGLVPLRSAKSKDKIKKSDIRLRDLPSELQADFGKLFTPALIRYVSLLPPWQNVDWEEVAEIWDGLFPDEELAKDLNLRTIVVKLADDKITAYRNSFSSTEVKALDELYTQEEAKTPEARADVVACLLEGNDTNRAFYYREYADKEGNVIQKGLFQSHLITRGLASHYAAIRSPTAPVEDPETTEFPETPLVYTIQAAKRALNYSVTGELVVPGQRLGEFSKANWGDKVEFREGRPITVNTTSSLVTVVRKLENKPLLWRKIIKAAIEASLPKKRRGGDIEAINVEAVPAADFDLVDNDSEWAKSPEKEICQFADEVREFPLPLLEDAAPDDIGASLQWCVLEHIRETVLMYIHRFFYAQAIIEQPVNPLKSTYAPSFLATYRAGVTILKSVREQFALMPHACARFWTMWTFAFGAAVVFGTVVTRSPSSPLAAAAMAELKQACVLFSKAAVFSRRATKALSILTKLSEKARYALAAAQNDPSPGENGGVLGNTTGVLGPGGMPVKVNKEEPEDELSILAGHTRFVSGQLQRGSQGSSLRFPAQQQHQQREQHQVVCIGQQQQPEDQMQGGIFHKAYEAEPPRRQYHAQQYPAQQPPLPHQPQNSMPSSCSSFHAMQNMGRSKPTLNMNVNMSWDSREYPQSAHQPLHSVLEQQQHHQQQQHEHQFYMPYGTRMATSLPSPLSSPYAWPVDSYWIDAEPQQQQQQQHSRYQHPNQHQQQQQQQYTQRIIYAHPQHAAYQVHNAELEQFINPEFWSV